MSRSRQHPKPQTSYTFDIKSNGVVLFGPFTGFQIRGTFMTKATAADEYEQVPEAHYNKVRVQPNWWSYLVKSVDVFHNNYLLNADDQPQYGQPFLDTYMYAHMTDKMKRYICTEPCAPGNGIPKSKAGWALTADSEWHKYSKEIFGETNVSFRFIPLQFPFFQYSDFESGRPPNAFPMSLMQSLTFRLNLVDDY